MIVNSGLKVEKISHGVEPVNLDMIKSHLSITFDDSNDLLELLAVSAREYVEEYLGISIVDSTVTSYWNTLSCVELPYGPVKSITSTTDGSTDISDDVVYSGIGYKSISAEMSSPVMVTYETGFTGGVPSVLKLAILKLVTDNYEQRTSISIGGNQTIQTFNNDWAKTCKMHSRKNFLQ